MKDEKSTAWTVIFACTFLIAVGLLCYRWFSNNKQKSEIREIENWERVINGNYELGTKEAAVKMVAFTDYQCPFCKLTSHNLKEIYRRYPDSVAIDYRHLPLEMHPQAFPAAEAAECAAKQGKFESYHEFLFKNQGHLAQIRWDSIATVVGVPNLEGFKKCLRQGRPTYLIKRDIQLAHKLKITSTPTLVINGKIITGAIGKRKLDQVVRSLLNNAN